MNLTNQIYSQGIFNTNLESFSNILNNYFIHFIIVAIASGTLIIIISKSVYRIGINFVLIGITSIATSLVTNMVEIPDAYAQTIADYLFGAMYQQIYFGVAFLIIGVMLMVADKYFK
jgi:tellurite resistance protein TehA-like permease